MKIVFTDRVGSRPEKDVLYIGRGLLGKQAKDLAEYDPFANSLHFFQRWAEEQRLREKLVFGEYTLWWFVDQYLYYNTVRSCYGIKEIVRLIDIFSAVLEKEEPSFVQSQVKDPVFNSLLRKCCEKKDVRCSVKKVGRPREGHFFSAFKAVLKSKRMFRRMIGHLNDKKYGNKVYADVPLIMTYSYDITHRDKGTQIKMYSELLEALGKANVVELEPISKYTAREMLKKVRINDHTHLIEHFSGKEVEQAIRKETREARLLLKEVFSSKEFEGSLVYKGVGYGEEFRNKIRLVVEVLLPEIIRYVHLSRKVIEAYDPSVLILADETGIYARALILAAEKKGIPVLAIQHGMIYPNHFKYDYSGYGELNRKGKVWRPLPTLTASYGSYGKALLESDGRYPKDAIVPTGQPRYDSVEIKERDDGLREQLGIAKDAVVVVLTTQYETLPMMSKIVSAMKDEEYQLIIKVHPRESLSAYKEKVDEQDAKNILVMQDISFTDLLPVSDVVVTHFSTTGVEAVMFGKALIIIEAGGIKNPFVQKHISYAIRDASKLGFAVERAVQERDSAERRKARETFIKQHCFRIDGGATERIVDVIRGLEKRK